MISIDDRLTAFVASERATVATEVSAGPTGDDVHAAHGRAHQIQRASRRRRAAVLAAAVAAVMAVGTAALWQAQHRDDPSSVTAAIPTPAQLDNPTGPQTGPAAPLSAFAHEGRTGDDIPGVMRGVTDPIVVRTGFSDRQLVVSFVGGRPRASDDDNDPCATDYVGTARLAGDRFVVGLSGVQAPSRPKSTVFCTAEGYLRTAVINLPEPLAGRAVVTTDDQPVEVVDASTFLIPRTPPTGWTPRSESLGLSQTGDGGFSWVQTYLSIDATATNASDASSIGVQEIETAGNTVDVADGLRVLAATAPGQTLDGRVVDNTQGLMSPVGRTTVRGRQALLFDYAGPQLHTLAVIWQEGTRVHAITLGRADTSGVTMDGLVAMAQSMTTATGG